MFLLFSSVVVAPAVALSHVHLALFPSPAALSPFCILSLASAVGLSLLYLPPSSLFPPRAPAPSAVFVESVLFFLFFSMLLVSSIAFFFVISAPSIVLLSVVVLAMHVFSFPVLFLGAGDLDHCSHPAASSWTSMSVDCICTSRVWLDCSVSAMMATSELAIDTGARFSVGGIRPALVLIFVLFRQPLYLSPWTSASAWRVFRAAFLVSLFRFFIRSAICLCVRVFWFGAFLLDLFASPAPCSSSDDVPYFGLDLYSSSRPSFDGVSGEGILGEGASC